MTKTLIKGIAEQESDPAQILTKVNRELCVDNESLLFVTLFLAILDTGTGRLTYSNAGHNPPARIGPDGAVSWLSLPRGVFLGIMVLTETLGDRRASVSSVKTDGSTGKVSMRAMAGRRRSSRNRSPRRNTRPMVDLSSSGGQGLDRNWWAGRIERNTKSRSECPDRINRAVPGQR